VGTGLDAQWSDDFHHALHVALTGETHGYYADFEPLGALAKVCERGFFHDGTYSSFRGRDHGAPIDTTAMPTWRLVVSSQNHDQVGNRAAGDRITEALDDDQLACAALLTLCGPFTPMLFQGEEWAASTPFQFFTSHPEEELGRATAEGRIAEFARHGWDPAACRTPRTRRPSSAPSWTGPSSSRSAGGGCWRSTETWPGCGASTPDLTDPSFAHAACRVDEAARFFTMQRGSLLVLVNFGDQPMAAEVGEVELLFETESGVDVDGGVLRLPAHAGRLVVTVAPGLERAEVDDLVRRRRLDVELLVEVAELQLARLVASVRSILSR
jgi:maltooligosyltrehalose trehalohydrolase